VETGWHADPTESYCRECDELASAGRCEFCNGTGERTCETRNGAGTAVPRLEPAEADSMTVDTFDHGTAENPFERRIPMVPDEATDRERELAEKYTRVSFCIVSSDEHEGGMVPDASVAWFVVEQQSFRIGISYCDTREDAGWYCWQFAVALAKAIEFERRGTVRHQCACLHRYDVDARTRVGDGTSCPKCGEPFDGGGPPDGKGPNNGVRVKATDAYAFPPRGKGQDQAVVRRHTGRPAATDPGRPGGGMT
jgi:hypothetical protein